MRYELKRSYARKLWFPYQGWGYDKLGRGLVWPPPRAGQLLRRLRCLLRGHRWSRWRVETEDWFEHVDVPEPYATRVCRSGCGALERVGKPR